MDWSFMSAKFVWTVVHLMGMGMGYGGAMVSDAMFFSSIADRRIINTEMRFLRLGSTLVWLGLIVMTLSGVAMVWLDPERLLSSDKFLAKMTVLLVLVINGVVFHVTHIEWLSSVQGRHLDDIDHYRQRKIWLLVSGVVSMVSWNAALVLGVVRGLGWSYGQIVLVYGMVLGFGLVVGLLLRDKLLPHGK